MGGDHGLRPHPSPDEGSAAVAWSGMGTCKPDKASVRPNPLMNVKLRVRREPRTGDGGIHGAWAHKQVILKSEIYHFHRRDLTRQVGFIVTVYDEDGLRLAETMPFSTPAEAFGEARKIVDNKVEGPRK